MESTLKKIVDFRSKVFDIAGSGKYGDYPYDETFNNAVEEGFNEDGTEWTARNGEVFTIN